MVRSTLALILLALAFVAQAPRPALADAQEDLAAGKTALAGGELEQALKLLEPAAQALPQSVEAQFALAECYLKLGRLDDALAKYRAVMQLSPDHAAANRMVAALTGEGRSFEQRMAEAQALLKAGSFGEAESLLTALVRSPLEPAQRQAARLLLVETRLWSNSKQPILADALRVAQESDDPALVSRARVLAALAIASRIEGRGAEVVELITQAGELAQPWQARAQLALALSNLDDDAQAAAISSSMLNIAPHLPAGPFRDITIHRISNALIQTARQHMERGKKDEMLQIIWPMASSGSVPGDEAVLQTIEISGGWLLSDTAKANVRHSVSAVLSGSGFFDFHLQGEKSPLLLLWLAGQIHLQLGNDKEDLDHALHLIEQLGQLSRPAPGRRTGEPLSKADVMQRQLILVVAPRVVGEQLHKLVDLLIAQVERYRKADGLAAGIEQFAKIEAADANAATPVVVNFVEPLDALPLSASQQRLWQYAAEVFAELGQREFDKAAATLAQSANQQVQQYDAAALVLTARVAEQYPQAPASQQLADKIVERYAAADRWEAALLASAYFESDRPGDAANWARINLLIRRATADEDDQLAANRKLGDMLSEPITAALAEIVRLVADRPDDTTRNRAIAAVEPLVNRYANLGRDDLAEQVFAAAATSDDNAPPLADWALWMRINLLERNASRALMLIAARFENNGPLALHELHQEELRLLGMLVDEHPSSPYFSQAVERVLAIAATYQTYQSFDTAAGIVGDFIAERNELTVAERFHYRRIEFVLAKAQAKFAERKDKAAPPAALSDEYAAAIDAIAALLARYPTGEYAPAAENALLNVARVYGAEGAWGASREVLDRFAAAIPDYRNPLHLRMLRAVTYLGELNREYGLQLLQPQSVSRAGAMSGNGEMLALGAIGNRLYAGNEISQPQSFDAPNQPAASQPQGMAGGGGFSDLAINGALAAPQAEEFAERDGNAPSETALAMIRQSQRRNLEQIAMLEVDREARMQQNEGQQAAQAIALPSGSVLSEAEMKRQDEAADRAYEILIEIIKEAPPADHAIAEQARNQVLWLFGFFEGNLRYDHAIVLLQRFLQDQPDDPARPALRFQIINDRLAWAQASRRQDRIDDAWLNERHERFEQARADIAQFLTDMADHPHWTNQAHMLAVDSYMREASLASSVSLVRAGGLLVQAGDALLALVENAPQHPQIGEFPNRLWNIAEQLRGWGQQDPAIYVLSQLPVQFPVDPLAAQAVHRIAELHAVNLGNPVKAVESYQEYLSLNGDNESIRSQIFQLGEQLASRQRYLEALHVYGAFVDSFPDDQRAAEALRAIGQIHQANEVWTEAIAAYERMLSEYPAAGIAPQVTLQIAECRINLSEWRAARRLYEEFLEKHGGDGQAAMATARLTILKNLDRYQTLLADDQVDRNKDDAQFQIARIVREQLANPLKAAAEFRKVVDNFPGSDLADDAQLEIGKALLTLGREDEAREALLTVASNYPNSPVADDALYLVGQSYEQQAQSLAAVTFEMAREEAFARNQRGAYRAFNDDLALEQQRQSERRKMLKSEGKARELALDEATNALRSQSLVVGNLTNTARLAEIMTETESALQVANRQDRIHEAYRQAVAAYLRAASEFPLGDQTDDSLLRIASIYETELKDRTAAMDTYQRIVKLFPGTPAAEDAAWKVALFHEQEGEFAAAVAAYRDFIRKFPAAARVADAQFALAEALEQLGQWTEAMDAYEVFRQKFGQHPKAQLAMEQINWIKAYRK